MITSVQKVLTNFFFLNKRTNSSFQISLTRNIKGEELDFFLPLPINAKYFHPFCFVILAMLFPEKTRGQIFLLFCTRMT